MATSGHLEEPRPPEDPVKRNNDCIIINSQSGDFNAGLENNDDETYSVVVNNDKNGNIANETNNAANTNASMDDANMDNSNNTNPKEVCISHGSVTKSESCRENNRNNVGIENRNTRRPASLPPRELNNAEARNRKRRSCQQDVEEALSSLLWQPYEYRTQSSDSSDTLSTLSLSTGSSSSTSLSYDYAAACKNKAAASGLLHSFTDEFLNMATPPMQVYHPGNIADPNLRHSAQMVSNLMVLDASAVGAAVHQYHCSARSRGRDGGLAQSNADSTRSRVRELVSRCARLSLGSSSTLNNYNHNNNSQQHQQRHRGGAEICGGAVRDYSSVYCDDAQVISGDIMRVEIPGSGVAELRQPDIAKHQQFTNSVAASTAAVQQANVATHRTQQPSNNVVFQCSSISVDGGGTNGDCVSVQTTTRNMNISGDVNTRSVCVSSDMIPSNITSVVSANVVGLPVHSRSSSNLSATGRADIVPPSHPRSVSDTTNVLVQPALHFRSSSNLATDRLMSNVSSNQQQMPVRHPSLPPISITTSNVTNTPLHAHSHTHIRAGSESATVKQTQSDDVNVFHSHSRQDSASGSQSQTRVPPLPNVSNVNVNFYRAVPVNVVSNVPTIQCLNSVEENLGNNVSNVHIVQAMPQVSQINTNIQNVQQQILVHQSTPPQQQQQQQPQPIVSQINNPPTEVRTRTFTSTEAQTDDTTVGAISPTILPSSVNREQRRRERRERRHQRRLNSSNHQHPHQGTQQSQQQTQTVQSSLQQQSGNQWISTNPNGPQSPNDRLPDLLNSHLPPPYSTLPSGVPPPLAVVAGPPPPGTMVPFHHPGVVPVVQGAPPPVPVPVPVAPPTGFRFPFPTAAGFRRCRSRLGPRYSTEEHQPKSCCGFLVSRPGSLRWFIALIALVAVCCVLVGTVLGAMRPAGRDHLTVSLLMIGVGIVLVTVSGVAWRLTSHDAPSCRAMLGLESSDSADVCTRRFVPRLPPSYGRPHHPYAAMIYPEFQYRPPPPSYQASMQEYRLRLLLLDRGNSSQTAQGAQHAVSPPPTYRSHAGSLLRAPLSNRRDANQSEYSCPPSYRSRSSNRQQTNDTIVHSREQSLSLSESNQDGSVVNVVNILANQEEEIALENMTLDSLKVAPENEIPPLRMLLKSSSGSDLETSKDGNLVTIVQKADQNPVIVTVSGSQMSTTNPEVGSSNQIPSEMEILAHL